VEQVLAADLGAVHDCMFANEALLDKLFALLEREAPLNTLLAGYFGKIISTLLSYCFATTFYHHVLLHVSSSCCYLCVLRQDRLDPSFAAA
jgi:hypothetical protein